MQRFYKSSYFLPILISLILFVIPFFWLKPNEMDLGGDETRLFFYDPYNFITTNSLYFKEVITLGNRSFDPFFDFLPFVSILLVSKSVINSPYFLISLLNGIKVSVSFFSMYLIIRTILQNSYKEKKELLLQLSSILGGLLYTTAPIVIGNYDRALLSHDQIFLNPLCFYLILSYFIKGEFRYLLGLIVITLVFTTSFAWPSAPPLFSFFPLSLLFLFLYVIFILKKKINYAHLSIFFLLFLGLHAFHIVPEAFSLFSPSSYINKRVFSASGVSDTLNYFYGVLPLAKLSFNILLYLPFKQYVLLSAVPAFFLFLGLSFIRNKNKTLFLTGIFFLITLYLVTANITLTGVRLYALFFHIPGFSMFRNFIGQWAFVYTFFYALLFGQAIYFLLKKINNAKFSIIIVVFIGICIIVTSRNFFTGDMVNKTLFQTNGVRMPFVIDPNYEQTIDFIRNIKDDGAFISFPFSDTYETVIHGTNNGAYEGPSPINWLTGRIDYNGYSEIDPFGEIIFTLVKNKNYTGIKKLFGLLNVKYIYYNDDTKVYNNIFPGNPYNYSRTAFPNTQAGYKKLINKIAGKEIYHKGTYHIYKTDTSYFHTEFYAVKYLKIYKTPQTDLYNLKNPFFDFSSQTNDVFTDKKNCLKVLSKSLCNINNQQFNKVPSLQFKKINPTLYQVHISNAKEPYFIVFSDSFSSHWDISLLKNTVSQDIWNPDLLPQRHFIVNGYANAWYILPKDIGNKTDYTLTIQLRDQKVFYIGIGISIITFLLAGTLGIVFLFRK